MSGKTAPFAEVIGLWPATCYYILVIGSGEITTASRNKCQAVGMNRKTTPSATVIPPVLTVRIVAHEHHVSTKTVRNWIEAGIIPAYRIGRVIRMRRSEVEAALKPVYQI